MKFLLIATASLFPLMSFAVTTSFKCQSVDNPGIHRFDAHGVINIDESNKVQGVISINVQKAQSAQSIQIFEEVRITGFIHHYKKGGVIDDAFDQLVVSTNEPYLKSLNLLLGLPNRQASKVHSIDNFNYRSNCKLTELFD